MVLRHDSSARRRRRADSRRGRAQGTIDRTVWYVRNGEILAVGNMSQSWSRVVLDPSRPDDFGRPSIAGYVISHANEHEWEALGYSEGHIGLIGVRPAWRGRKLAPALLAEVMRLYAAVGIDNAGLDVDAGNATGALSLYQEMGFGIKKTSVTWTIEGD